MGAEGLILQPAAARAVRKHASACSPAEACGFLVGRGAVIASSLPIANRSATSDQFWMDPTEMVRAHYAIIDAGLELLAVYHSHPGGPAGLSPIDALELAKTGLDQVIVHPTEGAWGFKAFRWSDGAFQPLPMEVGG